MGGIPMGGILMGIMGGNFVFYIEVLGGACFEQGNPRIRGPQAAACNIVLYHGTYYVFESITYGKIGLKITNNCLESFLFPTR